MYLKLTILEQVQKQKMASKVVSLAFTQLLNKKAIGSK